MVSAVENMAANTSWSSLGKAKDLRQPHFVHLGFADRLPHWHVYSRFRALMVWRCVEFMDNAGQGIGGMVSMFTGGALGRMGIFALGIMPYISASIIVQLMTSMVPSLEQLKKEGEQGARRSTNTPATARSPWRRCRPMALSVGLYKR